MRKPIADPYGVFPDRRPTLHEHCMRHQNCTGQGCRVRRGRWPKKSGPRRIVKPTEEMIRPPLPISHRIIDILPASQVIALWEFRQRLIGGEENALGTPTQAQAASSGTDTQHADPTVG